jgi:hypothetical protein
VATIQLELDEHTLAEARRLAAVRHQTMEQLVVNLIREAAPVAHVEDPVLGLFGDDPDLVDAVLADIMHAREGHPLRPDDGQGTP